VTARWSFGDGLGGGSAKTWWCGLAARPIERSRGFRHLRFSRARRRAPRLRSGARGRHDRRAAMGGFRPAGFRHLRFSQARRRAPRLRLGVVRPGRAACFDGWAPARVTCECAALLSHPGRCADDELWLTGLWLVGGVGGDGTEGRENLRCLKRKAHKVWRPAKPGHNVFPVLSSVHAHSGAER
jgi:hypothetical protein